jgi:hypothetical protein
MRVRGFDEALQLGAKDDLRMVHALHDASSMSDPNARSDQSVPQQRQILITSGGQKCARMPPPLENPATLHRLLRQLPLRLYDQN